MASKYAKVIDALPRNFGEEPDQQAKVDAMKREILGPAQEGKEPLSGEVAEELCEDAAATLQVVADSLIHATHGPRSATAFAHIYRTIRVIKKTLETFEKSVNVIQSAYEQILVDQYEAEGIKTVKFIDGGNVRFQIEPHAKVTDKDANREWAIKNGMEKSLSLPWQTVNAIAKANLLDGIDPPDGVEIDARPKVVFTKA